MWPVFGSTGEALERSSIDAKHMPQSYRGETLTRQLSRVLMSPPEYLSNSEAKNPFSRYNAPVDSVLALKQWEQLRATFVRVGMEVCVLAPHPGLEEMCFAANQAFVGVDREERSFAMPSRMLHRSRRDEVSHFARWFSQHGYRIVDLGLEGEEFLEGAGDLIWNSDWNSVWAGFGHRSTRAAIDQFAELMESMEFSVHKLEMVDPHFYNLNLCLAPLTSESLLLYPGAFSPETLARIRLSAETFEVSREDALQFICNGVSVNGYYITPRLSRRLEQILGSEGIEPIVVDLSEFQKAGGSVASLKMLLP
jgi:N-dimethylarginine dimethylaminohydrolase